MHSFQILAFSFLSHWRLTQTGNMRGVDNALIQWSFLYLLSGKRFCRLVGTGQVLFYLIFLKFMAKGVCCSNYVFSTLICCLVVQLYLTLCDPTDCSLPGPSAHGISQARMLEWVAKSFLLTDPSPEPLSHATLPARSIFLPLALTAVPMMGLSQDSLRLVTSFTSKVSSGRTNYFAW